MGDQLFGLIFSGFAGLFLAVGIYAARRQAKRLATYRPVPATVIASEVERRSTGKGQSYEPRIRFRYMAGGRTHECDTPLPVDGIKGGGSEDWAQQLVGRYPAGANTTAYVDPDDPAKAFLVREASIGPYVFILFPMIHFCVGVGVMFGGRLSVAALVMLIALLWNGAGIACLFHYRAAGGAMRLGARVGFLLYCGIGMIMLVMASDLSGENKPSKLTRPAPTTEQTPVEAP